MESQIRKNTYNNYNYRIFFSFKGDGKKSREVSQRFKYDGYEYFHGLEHETIA